VPTAPFLYTPNGLFLNPLNDPRGQGLSGIEFNSSKNCRKEKEAMMFGSVFMLGFGLIAMLLVIGLPVALIVVLIWALTRQGNSFVPSSVPNLHNVAPTRTCSHCRTALQADWSHCPQCGAQV
jgi:hypothetical protein